MAFTPEDVRTLRQAWPLPSAPRAITIVGAGGIVRDAHLPAYAKAGLPVAGLFDVDRARAEDLAARFGIPRVHGSLDEALAAPEPLFDLAVPPERVADVVARLPEGAAVLIQKPLGRDFDEACRIRKLCRERRLTAAVNFQLRFSPMMLAVRDAVARGMLGDIVELEVHLVTRTPWELWPFMSTLAAVEVPMHSIHYLDWIRSTVGEPEGVYSRSVRHPDHPDLADARTSTILDYGDRLRCCLSLNHTDRHGPRHQTATIRLEGRRGAALVTLGLLLNYPEGEPETVEVTTEGVGWTPVPLAGRWFPDAFVGTMSNLQRFAAGEDDRLHTGVDDAVRTMALVEACRRSGARGATPIPAAD